MAAALVVAECTGRFALGLANPVLYIAHPTIEYMLRPNQDVHVLGRHIVVNEHGMRSPSFPSADSGQRDLRALVVGDSVVNGGSTTDQDSLATSWLARGLAETTDARISIGNVSAGSWGPQNMLAWIEQFGVLDAQCVVIVLSSHDAADVPTFAPLDELTQPTRRPVLALQTVYRRLVARFGAQSVPRSRQPRPEALDALRKLFAAIRARGATPVLIQHFARSELDTPAPDGFRAIAAVADEADVVRLDDAATLREGVTGESPYRDDIHPNDRGQRLLAEQLLAAVQSCRAPAARDTG